MTQEISSEEQLSEASDVYRPRLLIVDDEKSVLTSLAALLRYCRPEYKIGTAASAEEALTILEHTEVDLLVTDLKLPAMNGLTLVQTAMTKYPETRSILMTAYGSDSIDYGAYRSGCVTYLEKPFDVERLLLSVDDTLQELQRKCEETTERLISAVLQASEYKREQSIRVDTDENSGFIIVKHGRITYADYGRLVGINALVAMLASPIQTLRIENDAPELSNADLPVSVEALAKAALQGSVLERIAVLRKSGRSLRKQDSSDYPEDLREEIEIQQRMLSETLQRMREIRFDAETAGAICRKRLPFHQVLHSDALSRQVQLKNLVNTGVEQLALRNFKEARRSWQLALEIDPNCQQAKRNLSYLERIESAA